MNGVAGANTFKFKIFCPIDFAEKQKINLLNILVGRIYIRRLVLRNVGHMAKRHGNLYHKIINRENLEMAADKALLSQDLSKYKEDAVYDVNSCFYFLQHRKEMLDVVEEQLKNQTFEFGKYNYLVVLDPKRREIQYPRRFVDKVVHHALMNICIPLFQSHFTNDTYASIKGKGTLCAAKRLSKALSENPNWYFLKIDVKKYYNNIDIDILLEKLSRFIKCKPTLDLFTKVLRLLPKGLAIGVFPSQYLANFFLSEIDHKIKEVYKVKHYYRFMDDSVFLLPSKEEAHKIFNLITKDYNDIGLTIKPNWRIAPISYGIDFLGYVFYPTYTLLRKRIKINMQKKSKKLFKNNVSDKDYKRQMASYYGWCKHADCKHLMQTIFKEKINLFNLKMSKYERLADKITAAYQTFGLPKENRKSITELVNTDIVIFNYTLAEIKGEQKSIVEFCYNNDESEQHYYFITRSEVIRDKLEKNKKHWPSIVQITKIKNYYTFI